jgi:hypothetical protein
LAEDLEAVPRAKSARRHEEDWPPNSQIVFSNSGKVNLTEQQSHIQDMLRASITRLHEHLIFEDSYPDLEQRRKLTGDILLASTTERAEFEAVKSRLMKDAKYVRALASVVRLGLVSM